MKLGKWSTTAGNNNSTPPDGWPEGQAPSTVNDCAREMMASIRTAFTDLQYVDQDYTPTYVNATSFTVPGSVATAFEVGRRIKAFDASTLYGTIISSTATTGNTGVYVRWDTGEITSSLSSVAISVVGEKQSALPGHIYKRKNVIINGQMEFWQRGTSFAFNSTSAGYACDRFKWGQSASCAVNITRASRSTSADNVPTLEQAGILYNHSLRISVSAADAAIGAAEFVLLETNVEGYNWKQIAHKPNIMSFWFKSNRTGTYCLSLRNEGASHSYVTNYTLTAANTWTKFPITLGEATTAGTWRYDSGAGLRVGWALAAGTNYQATANAWTAMHAIATSSQTNFVASAGNVCYITGVRLEEGNYATPDEQLDVAEEFARCQRYYQTTQFSFRAYNTAGNTAGQTIDFQNMRTGPTITVVSSTAVNANTLTIEASNQNNVSFYCVVSATGAFIITGDLTLDAEF